MYLTTGKFDPGGLIAGGGRQGHAFEGSEDESEPGVRANGLEALERLAEAKVANDVQSDVSVPVNLGSCALKAQGKKARFITLRIRAWSATLAVVTMMCGWPRGGGGEEC
ncbi:hypothetical protein HO133_001480 [Letharia lupina]|uniref:Uncharacterized protein n=1 Tax=Letharia lupina TaxID=560253 RepID=A0A8H6FC54_9LECA|nr:uncharacterized protein HO133_001480 [Letharia lupina]KAF6222394.1 hypothetical protein HO133_001480 [Letharia lupina]